MSYSLFFVKNKIKIKNETTKSQSIAFRKHFCNAYCREGTADTYGKKY